MIVYDRTTGTPQWFAKYDDDWTGNLLGNEQIPAWAISPPKKNKNKPVWSDLFVTTPPESQIPLYSKVILKQVFRRMIFGAYSRKYDRPRRKRKVKQF